MPFFNRLNHSIRYTLYPLILVIVFAFITRLDWLIEDYIAEKYLDTLLKALMYLLTFILGADWLKVYAKNAESGLNPRNKYIHLVFACLFIFVILFLLFSYYVVVESSDQGSQIPPFFILASERPDYLIVSPTKKPTKHQSIRKFVIGKRPAGALQFAFSDTPDVQSFKLNEGLPFRLSIRRSLVSNIRVSLEDAILNSDYQVVTIVPQGVFFDVLPVRMSEFDPDSFYLEVFHRHKNLLNQVQSPMSTDKISDLRRQVICIGGDSWFQHYTGNECSDQLRERVEDNQYAQLETTYENEELSKRQRLGSLMEAGIRHENTSWLKSGDLISVRIYIKDVAGQRPTRYSECFGIKLDKNIKSTVWLRPKIWNNSVEKNETNCL